ncbi:MAG: hypothetical protein ABIG96_06395 [Candidatus Micrarchaeota archaeon]
MEFIHFDARRRPETPQDVALWNRYIDARSEAFYGSKPVKRLENFSDSKADHILAVDNNQVIGGMRFEDAIAPLSARKIGLGKIPINVKTALWLNHFFVAPKLRGETRRMVVNGILKKAGVWAHEHGKTSVVFGVSEKNKVLQRVYSLRGAKDTGVVVLGLNNEYNRIFTAEIKDIKLK